MNETEVFLATMVVAYFGMIVANNKSITADQKTALLTAIAANQMALAAFQK